MSQNISSRTRSSQSRVWVYFRQCDYDPNKVRCNLCSVKLHNGGTTNILWNHVKIKHSIDKSNLSLDNQDNPTEYDIAPSKQRQTTNSNSHQNSNLDPFDYDDLTISSMKSLPSNSLSKNLISRLNQLSSPVTRKLKFWNKKSFQVSQYDPSFKVIYLGNLGVQLWSKDESCLDKPLSTLWNNYLVNMKTEIVMRLTICNSGLKAITRQHGLTQYWSNRLVYCCSHKNYPRVFSWVYRHEGKKMRQELRCHAVFCPSPEKASKMVTLLNQRLACALQEFRREKKSRSSSIVNNESLMYQNLPRTVPLRRQILAKGSANFRPPLERSKSAPKLTSIIEEECETENEVRDYHGLLQDEFEYEESFGDKEDSEYGDDLVKEEGSTVRSESNSLSIIVNEETSNSSAYNTGDRSYDRQNDIQNSNSEMSTIESVENNNPIDIMKLTLDRDKYHDANDHRPQISKKTKELDHEYSLNYIPKISHTNQITTSANTNLSSSSDTRLVIADRPFKNPSKQDDKLLSVNEVKNNNTSNNIVDQQSEQLDDITTRDIILSWSNLVIK